MFMDKLRCIHEMREEYRITDLLRPDSSSWLAWWLILPFPGGEAQPLASSIGPKLAAQNSRSRSRSSTTSAPLSLNLCLLKLTSEVAADLLRSDQCSFAPLFCSSLILVFAGRELRCCYIASMDGFSAADFHNHCDFKGPCVVIGCTDKGFKFGAFNPEGYRSTDDYYDTFDAFLFYWREVGGGGGGDGPVVLAKVGGSGAALFDYARGGPQFGADGLLIGPPMAPVMGGFAGPDTNSGVGDLRQAKSRLGLSYARREDGKGSLFGDETRATLVEVQLFCSPQIASLY